MEYRTISSLVRTVQKSQPSLYRNTRSFGTFARPSIVTTINTTGRPSTISRIFTPSSSPTVQFIRTMSTSKSHSHLRYHDKTVIVTGGSRGIGEGIIRVFHREGANVVLCGLGKHGALGKKVEHELNKKRANSAVYLDCDLTVSTDMDKVVATAIEKFGRLDCVVNNAGWHPHAKPIDEFTLDDAKYLFNLNLLSAWYMCKLSVPHLRKTKGNIINISSLSGYFGQAGSSTYCATKGGLTAMAKSIAIDEAAHDVRANTVSPGNVWTPLWEEHVQGPTADQDIQNGRDCQLLGRMGTLEEVGEVCLHLATSQYTTGHDYLLTGGAELGYARKTRKGSGTSIFG